jgi:hypothetical protein
MPILRGLRNDGREAVRAVRRFRLAVRSRQTPMSVPAALVPQEAGSRGKLIRAAIGRRCEPSSCAESLVVGAPGFEPGASCAQGRRKAPANTHRFSLESKNTAVRPPFGVCRDICRCDRLFAGSLQKPLHSFREVAARSPSPLNFLTTFGVTATQENRTRTI